MNQFDEFFEKKMNEEQPFSGQKRSWTRVNRDLHTFEIGAGIASRSLAIWKAVGIVALLSSVALVWERQYLLQEINKLHSTPPPSEIPAVKPQPAAQEMAAISPLIKSGATNTTPTNISPNAAITQPAIETHALHGRKQAMPGWKETVSTDKNAGEGVITDTPGKMDIRVGETGSSSGTLSQAQQAITALPEPIPGMGMTDTTTVMPASEKVRFDTVAASSVAGLAPVQDTTNLDPVTHVPPPVIDPVRSRAKRWSAGIQLSAGIPVPRESGISAILGQGIRLQYRVWRNLSLNASADFVKFDVNTDSISQHCSDIKIPPQGPGHHFFELKNVKSNRAMQQYNLGIGYTQKMTGRWSVTVQAAHT